MEIVSLKIPYHNIGSRKTNNFTVIIQNLP